MKKIRLNTMVAGVFVALAAVLVPAPSFVTAKEDTEQQEVQKTTRLEVKTKTESVDSNSDSSGDASNRSTTTITKNESVREDRKEVARKRLDDAKLKACTNREGQVNTIMDRVVTRSQSHINRITAVADKTKAFYEAQGNTSDVYFELTATVDTARLAAQTAVDSLSTDATFSCDSDGPKSDIQEFRNQRTIKITAVGAYRNAVKALIAAVKAVQPQSISTEGQQ